MIQFRAVDAALLIGGAIGIATTVVNPVYSGASLAFMGGILGGASLTSQRNVRKENKKLEAERVGNTFATLYDKNRGLIDPVELAFLANCPINHAHDFLLAVAEESNGQKIGTKTGIGVVFNFPHSKSALDDLSANANNWAKAQTKRLEAELDQHKRAIQLIRAQQAAAKVSPEPQAEKPDPWTTLNGGPGL